MEDFDDQLDLLDDDGDGVIEMCLVEEEEERKKGDEMLLNIIVPKEIFKTETGELMVWSSKHYVPIETTVKDYILIQLMRSFMFQIPLQREKRSVLFCSIKILQTGALL